MTLEQREAIPSVIPKHSFKLNLAEPLKVSRQDTADEIVSAETKSQITDPVEPPSTRNQQQQVQVFE